MKLDLTGLQNEVTPAIYEYASKKIKKLDKFFTDETIVHVTFFAKKEKQKVDIRIEYKGKTYLAEEETTDVYAGIDIAIDKILRQIRKHKTKILRGRAEVESTNQEVEETEEVE